MVECNDVFKLFQTLNDNVIRQCILNKNGEKFVHLPTTQRNKMLVEKIFQHPVFYEVQRNIQKNKYPSNKKILAL